MKKQPIKFSEYPLVVPTAKQISKKMDKLINDLKACQTANEAFKVINRINSYFEDLETETSVIYVLYTCNTTNEEYKKAQEAVDELSPLFGKYSTDVQKILVNASYRPELEKKYGSYLFQKYEAGLKTFDEKIMPDLVKENKLVSEYDMIFGGAQLEFRGETLNLSQLGKYMQDKDRETRKAAAKAMDKWLEENEEKIAKIYDELVHVRVEIAKKLGFKSFTELAYLRLGRVDYDAEMVKGYREQIAREVVPLCQKLYKQQIKNTKKRKKKWTKLDQFFQTTATKLQSL